MLKTINIFSIIFICLGVSAQESNNNSSLKESYLKAKQEYATFESQHGHYIQTENVHMHYLTWGSPKKIPLIWAHGSLLNSYELLPIANHLSDAGYFLICIDYYGHGKTPIPDKEVSLYHTADDILFLMNKLKIEKAILGGFSRGGYIAAAFYQSYPDRVKGLILEDGGSVAFNTTNHSLSDAKLEAKIQSIILSDDLDKQYNGYYETEFDAYKSLYDEEQKGSQWELLANIHRRGENWVTYRGLMDFFSMGNVKDYRNLILKSQLLPLYGASITMIQPKIIFRKLKVPMLILDPVIENDAMPFEKENIKLAEKFPKLITRIEYKNIEHNIHYSNPEKFTADLISFLSKLRVK